MFFLFFSSLYLQLSVRHLSSANEDIALGATNVCSMQTNSIGIADASVSAIETSIKVVYRLEHDKKFILDRKNFHSGVLRLGPRSFMENNQIRPCRFLYRSWKKLWFVGFDFDLAVVGTVTFFVADCTSTCDPFIKDLSNLN